MNLLSKSACTAGVAVCLTIFAPASVRADGGYAILVSEKTAADTDWRLVAAKLEEKHPGAKVLRWAQSMEETLPELRKQFPRWVALVAKPAEITATFVRDAHLLSRRLDDDPYTDGFWGIVTGFDAANALQIASEEKPLTIRKVASGTEVELSRCESGVWYCELKQGRMQRKEKSGATLEEKGPPDTTAALADLLTEYHADLFVTSGHATERDWQIGYSYRNGSWHSKAGSLFGIDTGGQRVDIRSENPKVYLPIGNCLIGHIDGPDAMALAFMKSAGVRQMIGYVKPTWYGYQGWGMLDYFVEQPGRFTLVGAFHANEHALIHRLLAICPDAGAVTEVDGTGRTKAPLTLSPRAAELGLGRMDLQGLLFDRDVVAFYGDPAWEARMAVGPCSWKQDFSTSDGKFRLTISPELGAKTFATVNKNGTQRGGRPIVQFLPQRIDPKSAKITKGAERRPVIADDFLLVPLPPEGSAEGFQIEFEAAVLK